MPEKKKTKKKEPKSGVIGLNLEHLKDQDDYKKTVKQLANTVKQLEADVKILKSRMGLWLAGVKCY